MQNTGFGLSAFLIAAGAILNRAVTYQAEGIDLQQTGAILFLIGIGLGIISLVALFAKQRTTVERESQSMVDGRVISEHQQDVFESRG